jgi:hypothetical protein
VQDADHRLAIKDLVYLPHLASSLSVGGLSLETPARPSIWPEHCVDLPLVIDRNVIVVGGADTNFWHAAFFEPTYQRFAEPRSTIPLALELREAGDPLPRYGSRRLSVQLAGDIPGLSGSPPYTLDERLFPTYGMILACQNPFTLRSDPQAWCVFLAGARSLGTSGAVLALAAMVHAMRRDQQQDFGSLVDTEDPTVKARVSAVLCRTTRVEVGARRLEGGISTRSVRSIPVDRLDGDYSDTYVPAEVEVLDYSSGVPTWRLLTPAP